MFLLRYVAYGGMDSFIQGMCLEEAQGKNRGG